MESEESKGVCYGGDGGAEMRFWRREENGERIREVTFLFGLKFFLTRRAGKYNG